VCFMPLGLPLGFTAFLLTVQYLWAHACNFIGGD
jgi:hypothetical protein